MNSRHSTRHDAWQWPHGAKAAISLTYDDGNANNLDQAMHDLEAAGFRGTFYLQTAREDMQLRVADWRAAFGRGHEIGNHTVHHWCRAQPYIEKLGHAPAWMTRSLENVSPEEIATEITTAADWLDQHIGTDPDRTFAHPCGALAIGVEPDEASYDAAILQRHFAARTCLTTVNHPTTVQMLRIGGFVGQGADARPVIKHCEAAHAIGGWTVLIFHGIGGPTHTFERAAHQEVVAHLRAQDYWVAPLKTVGRFVEAGQRANARVAVGDK
ncbi:MAG: polysaccharide deacetylase family protein [Cephaloticoccus sp.]|nr:polysaccharide deacetylase family protein [Cephaloticoccus sp.]MCF7761160.1 polysaccharide deacetylase family protein [Cephaloticoccus sp.]